MRRKTTAVQKKMPLDHHVTLRTYLVTPILPILLMAPSHRKDKIHFNSPLSFY